MAYPCVCTPCENCVSYPSCPSGNCLLVPSIVIPAETSVLPCGGAGIVDIGALSTLTSCTGTLSWALLPIANGGWDDEAFTVAAVDSNGVLSFTASDDAVPGAPYDFIGLVTCSNSMLSTYFKVTVYIKVGCYNVVCPEGESCNPCTGVCVPNVPDVILT